MSAIKTFTCDICKQELKDSELSGYIERHSSCFVRVEKQSNSVGKPGYDMDVAYYDLCNKCHARVVKAIEELK